MSRVPHRLSVRHELSGLPLLQWSVPRDVALTTAAQSWRGIGPKLTPMRAAPSMRHGPPRCLRATQKTGGLS
jgi:hypothetical protein